MTKNHILMVSSLFRWKYDKMRSEMETRMYLQEMKTKFKNTTNAYVLGRISGIEWVLSGPYRHPPQSSKESAKNDKK